jgi:two-component system response regulator LytT
MSLSILIVEDEFIIAEDISRALLANGYEVFDIADSYEQAIEMLLKGRPDFALLDITLDGEQLGLKLGKLLNEQYNIPYIYVTSHSDMATIEKVKVTNPSGYLLKPFNRESIYTSIEVALTNFNAAKNTSRDEQGMILKQGAKKIRLLFTDILFMESDGNYTHIHTHNGKFTERKKIKEMLDEFSEHPFIRVHKSYAVNKSKIQHFSREKITLEGHDIPIGRTYIEELNRYL